MCEQQVVRSDCAIAGGGVDLLKKIRNHSWDRKQAEASTIILIIIILNNIYIYIYIRPQGGPTR
jgi:hypothetical protein